MAGVRDLERERPEGVIGGDGEWVGRRAFAREDAGAISGMPSVFARGCLAGESIDALEIVRL